MAEGVMPFIFGGTTNMSLEELRRRQAAAAALAGQKRKFPTTLGEGMTYLGEAVGERMENDRLREAEARYAGQKFTPAPGAPAAAAPAARPAAPAGRRVPTESIAPGAAPAGAMPGAAPVVPGSSFSEAPADPLDRITAALMTSPQEVAQMDPTLGAAVPPPGSPSDDEGMWSARQAAIGGIESSDDYKALGVKTKYGRAHGRYGVMETNVPKWTAEALGRPMTPQEFLDNDKAQDAVFRHKFGQLVAKYGEEKAARAWYGGEGNINNLDRTDAHEKLSVHDYGQDYINRLMKRTRRSSAEEPDAAPAPIRLAALGGPSGTMTDAPPIGAGILPKPSTQDLPPPPPPEQPAVPWPANPAPAPNWTPRPNEPITPPQVPSTISPGSEVENPDQPTVTGDIRPMSVAPNQFAQVGPEMFSPRPMMSDASAALPAGRPPLAAPAAAAGPPGVPGALPPAPTPVAPPDPGPEPRRQGVTPEMAYYRQMATDRNVREDLRAQYGQQYQQLATQQEADYVRKWTDWRSDVDKVQTYKQSLPELRQKLETGHLGNIKTQRDIEGEGWQPVSPERLARLPKPPEGQIIYENRRGELKFGPTPPASTKINVNTAEGRENSALKKFHDKVAENWVETFEHGMTAAGDLDQITRLRKTASEIKTGPEAVAQQFLGRIGIKTAGSSAIEQWDAAINRLTPQQRVPGAGATSDFDAKMYRAGLPQLMNTPGGNQRILDDMESLARNKMARAEIIANWSRNKIDMPTAVEEMMKLQLAARAISDAAAAHVEAHGGKLTPSPAAAPDPTLDAAREWLKNNPDDPRAPAVRERLGR